MSFTSAGRRPLSWVTLLFLLLSGARAIAAQTTDVSATITGGEWQRYRVKDGEFSVLLPVPPALISRERDYKLKPTDAHEEHTIGAYYGGTAYLIQVFETKQSLDDFIGSNHVRVEGQFKRNLKALSVEGKEYGYDEGGFKGLTQLLISNKRTYVFSAHSSTLVKDPDANLFKFLESISFGRPSGNVIAEGPSQIQPNYSVPAVKEDDSSIFTGRQVTSKARVISKPQPSYAEGARAAQITGTVVLRCVFSSAGEVTNIRALSGLPEGLTEKAIGAARHIKFIPAIKDGRFVSTHIQLEYNFTLY
jgi:TonB family protein